MFESYLIDGKIEEIQRKFFDIYLTLFVLPFLGIVCFFLVGEVIFIVWFTRKIFRTINGLYDKIEMLNQ
jgi:hypothetical protein